jgi:undecaprenyl diphosphate synthase
MKKPASKNGPRTVALFMDGNRRWARAHGKSIREGHEAGKNVLHRFVEFYPRIRAKWGTTHYIFYAFSTENWNRAPEEVANIMGVFERAFEEFGNLLPELEAADLSIRFIGSRERLSTRLQTLMRDLEEKTAGRSGVLVLAVSYGGRADLLRAANAIAREGAPILEDAVTQRLSTHELPQLDLIIRPGGEKRLSNFLLWESAYAEIAFSNRLWPDFDEAELELIFSEYAARERRRGK